MRTPFHLALILLVAPACAQPTSRPGIPAVAEIDKPPIIEYKHRALPEVARNGMVAATDKLSAEIGVDILKQGGNAVDAAVATGFALAVSYPRAGNLAGGGFMIIHLEEEDRQIVIDYRETAPAAAHRDLYLNENGEVDRQREFFSHQSAAVPGTVAGLLYALENYGTMSLKEVLEPAISLAIDGLEVSFALEYELEVRGKRLRANAAARDIFFKPDGDFYRMGDTFYQSDLGNTLKLIAEHGFDGFYKGETARKIVDDMVANEGLITLQDLASYEVVEREPLRTMYRGHEVVLPPPPSSGGVHIIQMLNILSAYDLTALGHNSAAYIHHLTEVMKLAYADRSKYLADTDFAPVPVEEITSQAYADRLRKTIDLERARPSVDIAPGAHLPYESFDTTHYSVMDSAGNAVANTYTLNFSFGSGIVVPGTGMLLNNEMGDFAAKPGYANAFGMVGGEINKIEPRKRPLSSMTPTLVFKDGEPWLATGAPGGSVIITAVLQTLLNAIDFDMNIATAGMEARIHHQWSPDQLRLEPGISPDTEKLLQAMGHNTSITPRTPTCVRTVARENNTLLGATDPRRPGGWVARF